MRVKPIKQMGNKLELTVVVDTNDGDYVTEISVITQKELDELMPLIKAIKNFKPYTFTEDDGYVNHHHYNYNTGSLSTGEKSPKECYGFSEELHELFEHCTGYGGENGFHTIDTISVCPLVEKTHLL